MQAQKIAQPLGIVGTFQGSVASVVLSLEGHVDHLAHGANAGGEPGLARDAYAGTWQTVLALGEQLDDLVRDCGGVDPGPGLVRQAV